MCACAFLIMSTKTVDSMIFLGSHELIFAKSMARRNFNMWTFYLVMMNRVSALPALRVHAHDNTDNFETAIAGIDSTNQNVAI